MRSVDKGMLVTSGGFQVHAVDSMLLPSQEDEPVI